MYKKSLMICKSSSLLFLGIVVMMTLFSCHDKHNHDNEPEIEEIAEQAVFMFMPWAGTESRNNLYNDLVNNIRGMEKTIESNKGLGNKSVLIFICSEKKKANLIQLKYDVKRNSCIRDTLKRYDYPTPLYTTADGITSILNDVKSFEPAKNYAMTIGCHGMGWVPSGTVVRAPQKRIPAKGEPQFPLTRYFGGGEESLHIEISTLAEGIRNAAVGKLDYILFDVCYMSNIETAYELRNVTKYIVASTSEVMSDGLPYATIGKAMLNMDFKEVCDGFYNYYYNYSYPCGTIGVTDCAEIERMAEIMKRINERYTFDNEQLDKIQILDGLSPTVFFDFGDYVKYLCKDELLYKEFEEQLARLVPYSRHTGKFYSMYKSGREPEDKITTITDFSGVTISDPTTNSYVVESVKQTSWYKATH